MQSCYSVLVNFLMGNFKKYFEIDENFHSHIAIVVRPPLQVTSDLQRVFPPGHSGCTLFESKNERQKIEPVHIPLPRASRNFPEVKTRNGFFFHNWTSEIILFIRLGMQMDGT